MKMTVCFVDSGHSKTIWPIELKDHLPSDYIQLTEYGEIELPDLPKDEVIKNQLDQFDAMEAEIDRRAHAAKQEVNRRRQELLAITHTPTAD